MKYLLLVLLLLPALLPAQIIQPWTAAPSLDGTRAADSSYDEGPTNKTLADSARHALALIKADTLVVLNIDASAATYTVLAGTDFIVADATTQDLTIILPGASDARGMEITIKRTDASPNTCDVTVSGGGTMDGASSQGLGKDHAITLISDGINWHVVNRYYPPS